MSNPNIAEDDEFLKQVIDDSNALVNDLQSKYQGAAIPAILAAAAMWSIDFGMGEALKGTLDRTKDLIDLLTAEIQNQIN